MVALEGVRCGGVKSINMGFVFNISHKFPHEIKINGPRGGEEGFKRTARIPSKSATGKWTKNCYVFPFPSKLVST